MEKFKKAKEHVLKRAKELNACSSEYKRALQAENFEQLLQIIRENAGWVRENELFTDEQSVEFFSVSVSNLLNSGDSNSGDSNSGHWNSGDRNSGHRNSGHSNSGHRNSGHSNSGHWNSGHWNSGDRNSGFFNTKTPETIDVFNKPCEPSVWEKAQKPDFIYDVILEEWIYFSSMTDEEKSMWPKAFVCDGYLKTHSYKDAWQTAFLKATEKDIELLKALPNFDAEVFKDITEIEIQ